MSREKKLGGATSRGAKENALVRLVDPSNRFSMPVAIHGVAGDFTDLLEITP
jgi:hypothetical protein